jgi:hypothetical protein
VSTRVDILVAKAALDDHQAAHHCRPAYLETDPARRCPERVRLWRAWLDTAARWGTEPGDAARVRDQYAAQTALLGQRVAA